MEVRRLRSTTRLNDYLDWPGVQQVFRLERVSVQKRTGQKRQEADVQAHVPVQDMAELMSHHRLQLDTIKGLQRPSRHDHYALDDGETG